MLGKKATSFVILTLVVFGTITTMTHETYVVKADQLGTPNDIVNQTYRLLANMSAMYQEALARINLTINHINTNVSRVNVTASSINNKLSLMTVNGTLSLANLSLLMRSNASLMGQVNKIIHLIAGNNTQNWNLLQLNTEILYGLIDKDNKYILQNGTLQYPHGNSAIMVSLQNDVVLADMIRNTNDLQRNYTQQIVTASDNDRDQITTSISGVGKQIVNSIGNIQWIIAILAIIMFFFVFHQLFLKNRLMKYDKRLKTPQCYGEPRVFDPNGECARCRLKEDCERQIIAATAKLQEGEEAPKKKKRGIPFLNRNKREQEEDEDEIERPACFGQYLAGDAECIKCLEARDCISETPGAIRRQPQSQEEPERPQPKPTGTTFDPLAGM